MEWTDEQREDFGALWRSGRDRLGLSQQALADMVGVTQSVISALERGPYDGMRFLDMAKLAQAFHLSLEEVVSTLGFRSVQEGPQPGGLDALAASLGKEDQEFLADVVEIVVKGLRAS